MKRIVIGLAALAVLSLATVAWGGKKPTLPRGYVKWAKSREKVVSDKSSLFYGIHYIYVDKKALPAYKAGKGYPEGSRFVVVFYNVRTEGKKVVRGKKNMIVLMEKDKRETATGGWLFAGFTANGKPSGVDPVENCFGCHQQTAGGREFVISKYADFR